MEKNAKNFAIWSALQSGSCTFFCEEPAFYGGLENFDMKQYKFFCEKYSIKFDKYYGYSDKTDKEILDTILMIGIDYDQTQAFVSTEVSIFTDSFHEAELEDVTKGTLVLKDGQVINMFARCKIDEHIFEQMDQFFKFFKEV